MSMIRALALMGTGAENFVQGGRDEEAAQRLRSAETFTQQQRQFQLAQQQRVLDQQAADSAAAAPVAPAPDMAPTPDGSQVQRMLPDPSGDNIDAGQPGTAPPIPAQRVGSQGGMMPAQAAAAAAAANTPEAIQARQIANRQATNPAEAASMQTAANQAKLAKVQLASQLFDSDLNKAASSVTVGDWTPLEETLKSSGATGAKFSTKFVPSTDGKTVEANIVMPDGSLKPTGKVYPNGPDGALQAASFLSQATPIEAKVAHSLAASKEGREQAAQQSLSRYHDSLAKYHDSMAEAANKRGDAALLKVDAGTLARMSPDDKYEYEDLKKKSEDLDKQLTKGRLDAAAIGGTFDPANPTIAPLFAQKATLDLRLRGIYGKYRDGAAAPDPQGLRGKPTEASVRASAPNGGKVSPDTQTARDSDLGAILLRELATETDPAARVALQKEYDRLPEAQRAAPAAAPAAPPAAAPSASMQAATAPAPVDPGPQPTPTKGEPRDAYTARLNDWTAKNLAFEQATEAAARARRDSERSASNAAAADSGMRGNAFGRQADRNAPADRMKNGGKMQMEGATTGGDAKGVRSGGGPVSSPGMPVSSVKSPAERMALGGGMRIAAAG